MSSQITTSPLVLRWELFLRVEQDPESLELGINILLGTTSFPLPHTLRLKQLKKDGNVLQTFVRTPINIVCLLHKLNGDDESGLWPCLLTISSFLLGTIIAFPVDAM